MTPEEKILEAIGEKALRPPALWAALRNEQPAAIEAALRKLQRTGAITFELGHYQRGKSRPPLPTNTTRPPVMNPPADKAEAGNRVNGAPRQADPDAPGRGVSELTSGSEARPVTLTAHSSAAPARDLSVLGKPERQIFELIEQGLTNTQVAASLGLSSSNVSCQLVAARRKLGIKVIKGRKRVAVPKSAPSAAVRLSTEPSTTKEGSEAATVGAEPIISRGTITEAQVTSAIATGQPINVEIPWLLARDPQPEPPGQEAKQRITLNPDVVARLVKKQRTLAEYVQMLCKELAGARQDLQDIEEIVRIATAKEPA